MNTRVAARLDELGKGLVEQFQTVDPQARRQVRRVGPPDEEARWWKRQIVTTTRQSDFFVNLAVGAWWARLRLTLTGQVLHYVVVTQKVGRGESGVLAVTVFAELASTVSPEPGESGDRPVPLRLGAESVTLVHSEDIEGRWPEVAAMLDDTLELAVVELSQGLA